MSVTTWAMNAAERGWLPDAVIRAGIRQLLRRRLREIGAANDEASADKTSTFINAMRSSVVAPVPELANEQHYEVPAGFFEKCLGPQRKYSSCFWPEGVNNLEEAEEQALKLTAEHAMLANGQHILELGCGWGSLTLWMAKNFPDSRIVAISNSHSQRVHIEQTAQARNLTNVTVITADMNVFQPADHGIAYQFDRIVSVEMFEHMRNYDLLYERIHDWLKPGGMFFKHIFVHRDVPYAFETESEDDWMGKYFFSGGIMPSEDLPLHFQRRLQLVRRWRWNGQHYAKTLNAWLRRMDAHSQELNPLLGQVYGESSVTTWRNRWRIFFMACAELFDFNRGREWWVSHYLFQRAP